MSEPLPFGFMVKRDSEYIGAGKPLKRTGNWNISLPHQCEEWEIVEGLPHVEAVAELERFIAEAHAALKALREEREVL